MKKILIFLFLGFLLVGCTKTDSTSINEDMFGGIVNGKNTTSFQNNSIPSTSGPLTPGDIKPTYIPFEKVKYEQAQASGKIIFLEFYANWCPICKAQAPEIESAFSELTNSEIAGFRVNYNDDETDDYERALAKQFGITYQHTHVILDKNGNVAVKSLESWDKNKIKEELEKLT